MFICVCMYVCMHACREGSYRNRQMQKYHFEQNTNVFVIVHLYCWGHVFNVNE